MVLVVSTILFVGQTYQFLGRMPDVGLGFIAAVLPMFLPVTLALTLPLAFLVTAVLTYGRLADDNEVLAMRMAGIHPWAVAAPGVFAGAVLSFFCLDLQGHLAPAAVAGQDALRGDAYAQFLELVERGARNSFTHRDFRISWDGVERGELLGLRISRGGLEGGEAQEIHARRAVLQRDASGRILVFTLKEFLLVTSDGTRRASSRGASTTIAIPAEELLAVRGSAAKPRALTYEELLFRRARLPEGSERWREMDLEIFGRISVALAPLCFALCGIPLALLVGKGSRAAAAVLAFGVAVAFYVAWQAGNGLAKSGALPAAPAMLAADVLLAAAGVVLLRKAALR
ncbi:MAG: YjgP/YjgQ family permease [Planctomycetaceae bacterium]|nr:LptF/LptG family permease [Planctomycetota bacterium]NUN52912.1 YjgP/YjgQ family permease [Planctomycetaceae bacterium]